LWCTRSKDRENLVRVLFGVPGRKVHGGGGGRTGFNEPDRSDLVLVLGGTDRVRFRPSARDSAVSGPTWHWHWHMEEREFVLSSDLKVTTT
jgi:hypothetical protein